MKTVYQCQEEGCYSVNTAGYSDPVKHEDDCNDCPDEHRHWEEWMSENHKIMYYNPREGDRVWCAEHALKHERVAING